MQRQLKASPVICDSTTLASPSKETQSCNTDQALATSSRQYLELFERMHKTCNVETYDKQLAEYLASELIVKGQSEPKDLREFDEMLPPMEWIEDKKWKAKLVD